MVAVHSPNNVNFAYVFSMLIIVFFLSILYLYWTVLFGLKEGALFSTARFALSGSLSGIVVAVLFSQSTYALQSGDRTIVIMAAISLLVSVLLWYPLTRFFDRILTVPELK